MKKSNRHNLIAIIASLVAVVMIFGMAMILGGEFDYYTANSSESLDNIYDSSEDTQVESTGWISGGSTVTSGTAIGSVSDLQSFFTSSTATTGYLTGNISPWSLGIGVSTYTMSSSKTLYGNGYTIYISASSTRGTGGTNFTDQGGDIGLLLKQNDGKIYNLKVVFTGTFYNQNGNSTWVGTVAGRNTGTIQDVSVEVQGPMVTSRANGGSWGQIGGIVGYNSGKLNNVSFNLNCSSSLKDHTNGSNDYQFGSYDVGSLTNYAYAIAGGICGENNSSGVISGCTVKTTQGAIEVRSGSYCNKRVATVCGNNNGSVYGIVTDGSINLETGSSSDMYAYTNGGTTVQCGIDANGSNNSGRDLSTSSGFTWDWYFTGEGSSTIFHYKKSGVASGEYIYNIVAGSTTTNVASSKVKEATFNMDQDDATFNLEYYYDCIPYVIHYNNGTEMYNSKVSNGSRSWTYTYDGTAKTIKFIYYRVDDSGNTTTQVSESVASNTVEGINKGTYSGSAAGITYNASGTRDYCAASSTTFTITINARSATLKLPQFIYDKNGYNGGYYSTDASTWTAVNATDTDILNAIVGKTTWVMAPVGTDSGITEIAPSAVTTYESPSMTVTSGVAINSQTTLESFLDGSETVGYLTGDFGITYGANGSTKTLASGKTLYGNGYTITATYTNAGTGWNNGTGQYTGGFLQSNAGTIRDLNYIFNGTSYVDNSTEMNSSPFIGLNTGTITNCLVDYRGNYQVHGTNTNMYVLGGVVAYNSGTMNNVTFKMNTTTAANNGNLGGAYVLRLNTRTSSKAYAGGVVGINASGGVINGAKYIQVSGQLRADLNNASSDTPTCSMAAGICALNQGNIYGMLIEGTPNVFNEKTSTNVSHFAVTKSSATTGNTFSTSGAMPVVINGTTSTERDDIYTINLGYSYSTMSADDVEIFFSGSGTSTAITIALSSTLRSAGNKILTVGGTNYWSDEENRQLAKWTASDLVLNYSSGGILGTITYSINKPTVEYAPAGQGFIESDLGGLISNLTSNLQLSDGSTNYAGKLIAGYEYKTSNLTGAQLNSNYNITVVTNGNYYVVGNIDIRVNDLYHVYGREVYTWYAYNSSTHPSDYQYAIVANQVSSLSIDESLWLLDGTYYKTKVASYNNQVNAYTPTLSLDLSSDDNYDKITYSGITDTNIKKLVKFNIYNVVTNTTTTNVYIGKEMTTGNVYDLSVSQLGTASFISFDKDGYKFTFDASGMLKTGVTYVGFAVAGDPANADPSYLDISDATNIQVKLTRAQMETYFGTGNTFDLDLIYLYNATSSTESEVKDFLAGTSGKFGGAQKLTLTGDVTINSALSSVVVFNQFKTLDGAGYTITLNSATGADFTGSLSIDNPNGYPAVNEITGYSDYIYRGGLAAISLGTIQNVKIVLASNIGQTGIQKSYAIGGVVGINQGGTLSAVTVRIQNNQIISGGPSIWGTLAAVCSGGTLNNITISGSKDIKITNSSGSSEYFGYTGGVVGAINFTSLSSLRLNFSNSDGTLRHDELLNFAPVEEFKYIYNMFLGDYESTNVATGTICGVGYVSGESRYLSSTDFSDIVFFNKTDSALPFFSLSDAGKHDTSSLSVYGALGQTDSTAISLDNRLYYGTGITLKYKESYSTGADVLLDMLDYTISGTSIYFNRTDVRNMAFDTNTKISSVTSNGTNAYVTFSSSYFNATSSATTTNQITAVVTMSLAVTTANALNDFLKDTAATEPLMAIVNGIVIESNFEINTWDNSILLKVGQNRTLDGGNYTVTMNLTTNNKVYADYSSSDNWNGYQLVYDLMGVNYGTIQNLKFVGQLGNFSTYNLAVNHIIGSLTAINLGTISGVTYTNNGIGTYENTYSGNVNTIAGLIAGVNMSEIISTQVFNRAIFSVFGMFGGSVGAAMGAIAGVNDGGYADGVKVFGDYAIQLVSKTDGNNNTNLYVGGVFGVANNYGSLTFVGKDIAVPTADKAVISNANIIVAGGMGIKYSGGTIMPYGSRGIFVGIVTGELGYATENRKMTGLAFMDMQTDPNLAVSYVYDAGVLSYFASDRIFNNSLSNGELTMMGYFNYGDTTPDTSCVSGGKVDIFDSHGNSVFMYNYDVTTDNATLLDGLISYMNGGSTLTFDLQNVSSYMALNDYITKSWSSLGDSLETSGINPTLLRFFDKIGRADFATATTNNVVGGAKYKFSWSIDPSRVTGADADEVKSNIIKGFIEGKTAQQYRVAGAATALTLGDDVTVNFDGMSAGRVLESTRQIIGNSHTLTVNVGNDTLDINDSNAENLYVIEDYDVVGVGGLFAAILGTVLELNIVVNITGGTINATGVNLAVGGVAGIISGVTPTFGYVQVNYNGTTIAFDDGGKTLAFGGIFGTMYTKDGGTTTNVSLKQDGVNQVNLVGVTMTGNAQNVAVGGAVGLMQGSVLQGVANPTTLYLTQNSTTASGFDFTSTVSYSGTGGLGGFVGIMAGGSTLKNINIDQGISYSDALPTDYTWTKDMVWTFNGGSGSAVSALGGAIGISFGGTVDLVAVNSRARLINNVGNGAGDATHNYIGGLLGLGSNSGDMSLTGTSDAYTETINGTTYTLTTTKINNIYAGQIGMIAIPDGGYAGYVTGRFINAKEAYGTNGNLQNLVWIDYSRKTSDLYSKIQVFGATDAAGITLSNVAGMSVLGYVSTDMYNTLTQAGYNKSGSDSDTDKMATYSRITACDFKGTDISIALTVNIVYHSGLAQYSLGIRLIGTLTTGGGGYTPYSTTANVTGTEYLRYWTAQVMSADNETGLESLKTIDSGVLSSQMVYNGFYYLSRYDGGGKHNNLRIQLFRNEVIITTETQLQEFISGLDFDASVDYTTATAGVLGANITLRQEPNKFVLDKPLYGSNYTITLVTASADDRTNTLSQYVSGNAGELDAYGTKSGLTLSDAFNVSTEQTPIKGWYAYLYGLFVGYISPNGGIYDVNFEYNQALVVTRPNSDGRYSMAVGIISSLNAGTIQNCTLTLGSSTNFIVNRSMPKSENSTYESYKNICIAGGFTAMMIGDTTGSSSNEANMINCTLNMDEKAMIKAIGETHRNANMTNYPHAQTMAGGMIGWMGKNSNLINSTLNGGGLIEARTNMVAWFAAGAYDSYRAANYIMQQMYSSGAGALVGVNTQSYYYYGDATSGADNDTGNQPYTNVVPLGDNKIRGVIDGVIINWYGFTLESITAKAAEVGSGYYSYSDATLVGTSDGRHGDLQKIGGQSTDLGPSLGYRQIAGICDWEQINNAYLVSRSDSGTTPCVYTGWTDHNVSETDNWFEAYTIPAGTEVATRYVGRGGEYSDENPAKELYVYDNTDPDNIVEINKDALGSNVSISWDGIGIDAKLSFNFTIADPTAEGKFLWDTQVWQVQPEDGDLLNSKPEDAVVSTEGDGWTLESDSNYVKDSEGNNLYKKLLFYNDVYDKINNLSDAIHYADVSHTFNRGNNVYLYYSYGTTGSASIDRTQYYYDSTTGVYYHKTTTSFGDSFDMPALKFYAADGTEIPNSTISSTLYRSLQVYNFTGIDPNNPDSETQIVNLTYYDKDDNVIADPSTSNSIASVGLNKPIAGSYRISFDTESEASVTSAIKDISSKTIIFPENDIVSGNFKVVEIITPFGLYAEEITLITEYKSRTSASNSQIDVQPIVGREDYIAENKSEIQNINWTTAGLTYVKTSADIGVYDIKITLKDWEYYGYLPTANDGNGGLGYNRTYLINGSGFSLEYDFAEDATNDGITINGSIATLSGRGLVIPTDVEIEYVQKTYDTNSSASSVTSKNSASTSITYSSFYKASSSTKDANAGNGKGVSITGVGRVTYNGNWFDIDRYYSTTSTITTGYGFRATTADNWNNTKTADANPSTNHTFINSISVGSTGELIIDGIGTILPKCGSVSYISKIYDGDNAIDYSSAKTSYDSNLPNDLKPEATFGSASVVYGGQNSYNSLVFEVVAIQDMTQSTTTYVYAFVDRGSYGNNYGISNAGTVNGDKYTVANIGVIVPDTVSVTKVKKVYDNTTSFKTIGDTLSNSNMLFTISNTAVGNKSIAAGDLGFTTSAGTFDTANVGVDKKITFTNATKFEYPTGLTAYSDRYFMTTTVGNYALTATQYSVGVIVPRELTWVDNVKNLVYKTYDNTTSYSYSTASTLFSGLVESSTKPTITFTDANVNTSGVEISVATTSKVIDGTTYNQLDDNANYCMPTNTATGMILPKLVSFSNITKVYDGTTTLSYTATTGVNPTTMTTSGAVDSVSLTPKGVYDGRHAYESRQVVWTTTSFTYNAVTYKILQEAGSAKNGTSYAGNYYVSGNSDADITPCTLTAADFLGISATQSTTNATGLTFVYFAGAVYIISGSVNKKNDDDDVDGDYALYKSSVLATTNSDGTYDVGTYDVNVTALTGDDAGDYTLAVPFDTGKDLVINQQEVSSIAITVMPTNVNYGADLPTATANSWSAKDSVTGGEISGLNFGISTYQWIDASKNAVTKTSPIGGYDLSVTAITMTGNDNYKLAASPTYTVTVTPNGAKALYILPLANTISKVEKVYDGTTDLGSVTATQTIANYVGEYESKNVQGYDAIAMGNVKIKVVTFTYYDNTGAQNTKYVIVIDNSDTMSNYYLDATVTGGYATLQVGVITPREVTVSGSVQITQTGSGQNNEAAAPGNFEYFSTATYAYSATLNSQSGDTGVISGDDVSLSITGPTSNVNAGTYDLEFNGLTGADSGNYTLSATLSAQLIVKPQTLGSVSVTIKPINVVYGNAIPATVDGASATANDRISGAGVTGNFTINGFTTAATSTSPIGGYDIDIDYSKVDLAGTTNYVIGSTTVINVAVTPAEAKALYITPADATLDSVTKTYDGTVDFTAATAIVTTPASLAGYVTGVYADKNAGAGKAVKIDLGTFEYFDTQGDAASAKIFVGTNYTIANDGVVIEGDVATVNVGVINQYAIKGSEITGATITQTWKDTPSTSSPFTYYYTATYVATGTFSLFDAYGDSVTVTLGIYKSTDASHINVSGATDVGVGTYNISLLSVSASPENFKIDAAEQYSNTTTFKINPQVVVNVYVVGNHYATTYTGAPLTYDTNKANFSIYAIDADNRSVDISGGIKEDGLTVGVDGQTFATNQTQVGIYNVKVSVNGSAEGNNYSFSAINDADVYIDAGKTAKTEFAIIPMQATLDTAYKTYDGNTTLDGATVVLLDVNSTAIDFGTAVVSATFDSANAGNRKLVFVTKEFAYYPTGMTSKTTLNIIQTSTTTPAEDGGEASVSTDFTNYHIGSNNTIDGVAYIIPKLVDLNSPSKVYDGTTALGGEVSATGTIGGEKISISGSFDDCNAGENIGITINVVDMELGGVHYNALAGNTNYYIAANNYTGTITPKEIETSHLSLLQLARLDAKDGDKQVALLDIAGSESLSLTDSVEYTSMYKYQGIGGHLYVALDKDAENDGNWSFKLYQSYATEIAKGLTFTVTMLDKNGTEVDYAQNAGAYTIKVVFGGGNYKESTLNTTFTINQQEVTDASNIYVYMDSFEGVYGQGTFKSPSASGYTYIIGIVDKVSGDIVEFVKGASDNSFTIATLAFSRTQSGTANTTIDADAEGIYIGGYYLFAASVTGVSDNFDTSGLNLSDANKKIYGIGKAATDDNQSIYYILPAQLDLTAVTKTYDGTVDFTDGSVDANNVTTFTYGSGVYTEDKTMRLKGEFVDYNATHNGAGTSGTKGAVTIATEIMAVTTLSTTTNYNIALTESGVKTNYYLAIGSAETTIEVADVAVIKKYIITDGAIQLSVEGYEGYVADSENKVIKYINTPTDTITFTYANGYRYNDKFVITGLQAIKGRDLFNATDDINAMSVVLGPDNISNADTYVLVVKTFTASNYEWGSNATIGTLTINKQIVNEDSIAISIPPLALEYNGEVQKPEGVDKFSFTVKDFYTGLSAKADGAGGSGVSGIKYYMNSVEVPNPINIGGYSVSVVVDTSYIDTNNYTMENDVSSITKQADNGNAVFFILPKALTVTNVTKQYDGSANFVDMQVNGVTNADDPKTIITIDESGFVAADNTTETKTAVYNAIIAAGGRFDSKDIAETVSVVYFNARALSYRNTVDEVVTGGTAYYINGTNYMVTSASVGYITPAHLTITGMTKTYDGTKALQFEYSYDSNTQIGINKTTETVVGAMNSEAIRPAGEYTSADVGTNIAVKFNVTAMVIDEITYYRLVANALDGGTSNASNYYIFTSDDGVSVVDGMITIDNIGTIKAIAISDGTTGTTADASISNITIDGKAYDSLSAFIYNYSKSYTIANLEAKFNFFGGELVCQGTYDSTKGMMKVDGVNGDTLYFSITFAGATSAKDAGAYVVKIELKEISSVNNNAYDFGTDGVLTLSKNFTINKYQLQQDELKIYVAALEREYDGKEGIVTDGSNATTWVAGKVESTLTYTITLSGATTTSTLTIYSVKKTNDTQEFINVGQYALQAQIRGYSDTNYKLGDDVYYTLYSQADQSTNVFEIIPKKINLDAETIVEKNFDGTVSYLYAAGVAGEQVLIGNTAIAGEYARAGVHTLENTTLDVLDVVLDPTADGFNSTLYNDALGTVDRITAKANYEIVGTTTYKLTINPSNIVVAERRYIGPDAEIEVAITGLAGMQFINNTLDETNLAGVLRISVNSYVSFETATVSEIGTIQQNTITDDLGYETYTIVFKYVAQEPLDQDTYTDRYVFAIAGASSGYSTNFALTSSELADGQMGGAATTTGTAVATAEALATALQNNADIYLTSNIYDWDASAFGSAVDYTGTLYGNGYSIQLAGGLNSDGTDGGAFIAALSGTIQDVNFKFTSTQTLSATNVGLVVGSMTGNMTNVSLDIINTPTFDGATVIGGLAATTSGSMTNATVIFNADVDNTAFGGLAGSATGATFTNVSVRAYNDKTTTGKTLVATATGCTFNGVIDMIGDDLGVSGITNLYTVNTALTSAKAYGVLELLTPYTEGFIEYYFTTLAKTCDKTHNVYGGAASERDKTMYQTYGTVSGSVLAIETLAPRNRFIWEAYSHSYQTETVSGHINMSLNRYVALMPIGTIIEEDGYTLDGQSKTDMSFITSGVTMFCPAIGIRGGQEIAASGSTIVEAVYTGEPINHTVEITVDGITTTVSVTGTEAGYYDNIVKELEGDITTDNINYDTYNRIAIVAAIDDGSNVAGAILIIYPKQTALADSFTKTYDTTSIGEFTTTVDGKSVTLLGTYVDSTNSPASDVGVAKAVSFANTLNPISKVLVDTDGNYIAQHHKTDEKGVTTFSYTKISVTTKGGIESNFTTSTDITTLTKNSLMRALAQLIDYDTATSNDNTLASNASYKSVWVYDVTAIKAADVSSGYFDEDDGLYFVPKTINTNAGNFTFTASGLTIGSLTNIYIGETEPTDFDVLAGTTSSTASITPAQREATYNIANADKLSFRTTHTKDTVSVVVKTWNLSAYESTCPLPTTMTAAQREAFSNFMSSISTDGIDTLSLMSAESGSKIIDNAGTYSIAYTASDKYFVFKLPETIAKDNASAAEYGNYVIVPDSEVIEFRYFIVNANGEFELSSYKDVLTLGERFVVEVNGVEYESNYHTYDYVLTDNINMKSALLTPFDWGNGTAFAGSIDGQGYALTNYIVKGENNVGLFASMGATASVTDLIMGNVMVVATATSGEVTVSAISTTGTVSDVATEMRVVTATTGSVTVTNVGESFVRVHKQSGSDVAISTRLNGAELVQDTYLTPSDIDTLTKFGGVANFLDKYVLNNAKLTYNYNSTAGTLSVNVNNFREYWGWYNICPWLEGGNTWNGIRPTKVNTVTEVA